MRYFDASTQLVDASQAEHIAHCMTCQMQCTLQVAVRHQDLCNLFFQAADLEATTSSSQQAGMHEALSRPRSLYTLASWVCCLLHCIVHGKCNTEVAARHQVYVRQTEVLTWMP